MSANLCACLVDYGDCTGGVSRAPPTHDYKFNKLKVVALE
jgi:hypothetical protein